MAVLLALIAVSFCTATALILINKQVMNNYGFEYPTFLTAYHFGLGLLVLNVMVNFGFISADFSVPKMLRWTTGAFGVGSIVFLNLNLKVNSIGFYQLSKLSNIPMMVIYKFIFKGMKTPLESLLSLAVLLVGLALFTVNDVEFHYLGFAIAAVAITSTTVFQSRSAFMQGEYGITGPQLNHIVALPEFVLCSLAALAGEATGAKGIVNHVFQGPELGLVLLTGLLAVYGNIIGFIMLGKLGPVTFQVIGHVKTILVFVFGLMMFPPKVQESNAQKGKKIAGLIVSMIGVILYTFFELRIKAREAASVDTEDDFPDALKHRLETFPEASDSQED